MRRSLGVYQYLGPVVLLPAGYWLWWRALEQDHRVAILILSMPILFSYVIPAVGANVLGLWEFHTRLRWGRVRPHHGFVFGSATGMIAVICLGADPGSFSIGGLLRSGFVLGSVLAFWNWLYDVIAVEAELITVYNRPFSQGRGAEAIVTDYAPVLFGTFGACYGAAIYLCRHWLLVEGRWELYFRLLGLCNLATILLPVGAYVLSSYVRTGTAGLTPCYKPREAPQEEKCPGREDHEASVVTHGFGNHEREEP